MVDRPVPDRGVGVSERAELVVWVLEEIGVHRAGAQAAVIEVVAHACEIIDVVPREVQRDGGCGGGEAVDLGGVVDPLEHVAWTTGLRKHGEAGARVAVTPR